MEDPRDEFRYEVNAVFLPTGERITAFVWAHNRREAAGYVRGEYADDAHLDVTAKMTKEKVIRPRTEGEKTQ